MSFAFPSNCMPFHNTEPGNNKWDDSNACRQVLDGLVKDSFSDKELHKYHRSFTTHVHCCKAAVSVWEPTGSWPTETMFDRQLCACSWFVEETKWQISSVQQGRSVFLNSWPPVARPAVSHHTHYKAGQKQQEHNAKSFTKDNTICVTETAALTKTWLVQIEQRSVVIPVTMQNLYSKNHLMKINSTFS